MEHRFSVVIADDEAPAREELAYLVGEVEDVGTVAQAAGGMEAIRRVQELLPDVLFLDMEMPDLNGRQVAQIVADLSPATRVVFSTAYDNYAVDAFRLRAFHYLLKPYDDDDIREVFRQLRKTDPDRMPESFGCAKAGQTGQTGQSGSCFRLALEVEGGIKYVAPQSINYISKEGKHVQVHTAEGAYDVSLTLQELEQKLIPFGFFRCHRSYLVRLEAVSELKYWVNGAWDVRISGAPGCSVPVSRGYVKDLRLKLEI